MKKNLTLLVLFTLGLVIIFSSCSKDNASSKNESDMYKSGLTTEADLLLKGDGGFVKVITSPLVKIDDCDFIVAGTIEFHEEDVVIAVLDYGDGTCDDIATITKGDKTFKISLKKENKKDWFYKVVTEPIIKIENCDFIVAGVIDFYSKKDDTWLATLDFGDGTCDEWATKITNEGTFEFSMNDWKKKQKP